MSPKVSDSDLLNNLCAKCGRQLLLHVDGAPCPGADSPKHVIKNVADVERLQHMYYCTYGLPPDKLGFGDDPERCICGALTRETSGDS